MEEIRFTHPPTTRKHSVENLETNKNKRFKVIKERKTAHSLTLKKLFIQQIREGLKVIEARPYCRSVTKYQVGDTIRFYYFSNSKDDVTCKITKIQQFPTFEKLLEESNFSTCIPASKSLKDALQAYHKIPKYTDKERAFGVVAIHLNPLSSQTTHSTFQGEYDSIESSSIEQ